jgi:mRNA interferase RelE/StbE
MYEVILNRESARTLEKVTPAMRRRIISALEKASANPQSGKRLRGSLEGLFSIRIGEMRAIYEIDNDQKIVVIHSIGPRGDIYKR